LHFCFQPTGEVAGEKEGGREGEREGGREDDFNRYLHCLSSIHTFLLQEEPGAFKTPKAGNKPRGREEGREGGRERGCDAQTAAIGINVCLLLRPSLPPFLPPSLLKGAACVLLHAVEYRVVEEMDRATGRLNKSKAMGKGSDRDTTGGGLEYTKVSPPFLPPSLLPFSSSFISSSVLHARHSFLGPSPPSLPPSLFRTFGRRSTKSSRYVRRREGGREGGREGRKLGWFASVRANVNPLTIDQPFPSSLPPSLRPSLPPLLQEVKRSVPCYLVDPSTGAGIALDIGGDPLYLDLQTVHEEFKPSK